MTRDDVPGVKAVLALSYPACLKQICWSAGEAATQHSIISDTSIFLAVTGMLAWQLGIIGFLFDIISNVLRNKISVLR